jgi:hypothetical protein
MGSRTSGWFRSLLAPVLFLFLPILASLFGVSYVNAQTTQPYLFAGTYDSSTNTSGFVTRLRDSTTGVLTLVPNTAVTFSNSCNPAAIDPTGSFLYRSC